MSEGVGDDFSDEMCRTELGREVLENLKRMEGEEEDGDLVEKRRGIPFTRRQTDSGISSDHSTGARSWSKTELSMPL